MCIRDRSNTRSQKGEKEKHPAASASTDPEVIEEQDLEASVMDRTKKLKLARDAFKKKARHQQSLEEEAHQLDQLVADTKAKVEAIREAKARAAESRRILQEYESEMADEEETPSDVEETSDPVSKSEIGALVASSLRSTVRYILYILLIYSVIATT